MSEVLFKHDADFMDAKFIKQSLIDIGAQDCDVLYIHSGMNFGIPNPNIGKVGVLEALASIIYSLDVATVLMPSYTFSFCNGERYDVEKSKSSMGALSEFFRKQHHWKRSIDPLMSNIGYGSDLTFISDVAKSSVGQGSTFDLLSKSGKKVKFLFIGPMVHECFTFMHYLEDVAKVPYRYDFQFSGEIKVGDEIYEDEYKLFIRDDGVVPGGGAKIYSNILFERNLAKTMPFGAGRLSCLELNSARNVYLDLLDLSPNFYIEEPFMKATRSDSFSPRKMVAL